MGGILYLVGTPIGNLQDLSPRAAATLEKVDFIAAEDTRVTMKLLSHLDIHKPMVSYYEHNRAASGEKIVTRLLEGECCALVTDAGMPAISDPGEDLVKLCAENGIKVETVPGPSAVITALAASGLPTGRFCFEGFLSRNTKSRKEHLAKLVKEERTMVFYEAPHKLLATLKDMLEYLGERNIALCRELTKLHEEIIRTTLSDAIALYEAQAPRGEYVLVLEGCTEPSEPEDDEDALSCAVQLMKSGLSMKDAAKQASQRCRVPRNKLYAALLEMQNEEE
ncbi:MAG: 16S rRNA (cytidine(1402)-2'-O)-methyltransferase [Oscillospiraceae bacterium]|nr:16S rRNA (cytidine(1402)-2'-O)-methyltransferase [Oscillospiraceae bacterium]